MGRTVPQPINPHEGLKPSGVGMGIKKPPSSTANQPARGIETALRLRFADCRQYVPQPINPHEGLKPTFLPGNRVEVRVPQPINPHEGLKLAGVGGRLPKHGVPQPINPHEGLKPWGLPEPLRLTCGSTANQPARGIETTLDFDINRDGVRGSTANQPARGIETTCWNPAPRRAIPVPQPINPHEGLKHGAGPGPSRHGCQFHSQSTRTRD